jgi:hypothetical protein
MPRRSSDYHGGGSGWRFSWRPDRMQRLHELGQEFDLTEDSAVHRLTLEEKESVSSVASSDQSEENQQKGRLSQQ